MPVVATDCRGNRDLIQEGINGYLVKIDDVNDLIVKIKSLLNHNTKTLLDEKYSINNCIAQFIEKGIYE